MGQLSTSTATPSTRTSGPRRHPLPKNATDKGLWWLSTSSTRVMSTKKRHTSLSLTSLWVWIGDKASCITTRTRRKGIPYQENSQRCHHHESANGRQAWI
ncbi:DNA polymerase III subunit beta [Propionibacterium sp. NM47_B9-13]|uniref:Uncharacterized protein n=1 Tax=Cutibacterium modestum HL044PA1 TaxID=765109 RepID=A0ABP2K7R0_9ACTN|nr:hypothetical protein HMPREF9621_02786 [Cutibacterium modestum HL037PA2]EFS92976.1 hypothetical protein HMPREF9607_00827 [Cutibacterium modestum HL044PA1]EFT15004.1 hypothetical protein HMPREF9622_01971 [Cutibacterium modestum HL037PA3]REB73212.1 DNA polymerase III subunit beta [Cutibacterium modestum]TGY28299.1 DNA polymerase III subunit beta [Propionibacterium sp. NM47_B9-13]